MTSNLQCAVHDNVSRRTVTFFSPLTNEKHESSRRKSTRPRRDATMTVKRAGGKGTGEERTAEKDVGVQRETEERWTVKAAAGANPT